MTVRTDRLAVFFIIHGTQSVVHFDTVQFLADESEITVYRHDDEAFREVMMNKEWTEQVEEDII